MSINSVTGVRSDITELLAKIREVSNKSNLIQDTKSTGATQSFGDIMSMAKGAIGNISHIQNQTETLKNAYIMGDSNVSMSQVVVASQKSKLAFEGLVSVRNKILEAYKEIMNMPV